MQITHLLAGKVAARLSAVTVGSTVGALVDAVAAGNWVNGIPSFSLSVDALDKNQPSLNHSHYHPTSTIHA